MIRCLCASLNLTSYLALMSPHTLATVLALTSNPILQSKHTLHKIRSSHVLFKSFVILLH